ncbi:uncharacterized protein LOC127863741 [Dreissena polymorpha]|uniref:Uncharacterized protein n=1 Tax=Dreissena polymorpha TaxID=45954 RepID=A0A9D3XZS2_DREPO|nr:uncharacterized protein LOC127863741 [Dreissena polymorpha]KAH3690974.1 hypothetical protein DPMN_192922 [Dreissena polymorpha]
MDSKHIDGETLVNTITTGVARVVSAIKSSLSGSASSFDHAATAPSGKCLSQTFKRLNAEDVNGGDTFENIEFVSVVRNEHTHQQEYGAQNERTAINSNLQTGPSRPKNEACSETSSRCTKLTKMISDVTNASDCGTAIAAANMKYKLRPNTVTHDNRKYGITGMHDRFKDTIINLDHLSKCDTPPKLRLGLNSSIPDQDLRRKNREHSISSNNNCSSHNYEGLWDSATVSRASYEAIANSTASSIALHPISSLEKSGSPLTKSPSLTDLSILTQSFTGSGYSPSALRNSLVSDYSSYFDKKRNELSKSFHKKRKELSKSSVIHNSNREFEDDLKFLSGCGDKTSTPDRPMFEHRPDAVFITDLFQKPTLTVPRSLPPSLSKVRSSGLELSPITNLSLVGSDISTNRTNQARRSLKFDDEIATHGHRTPIVADHRRSFSDIFVPKLSGQHTLAHINCTQKTYPVIDTIEGELGLHRLQPPVVYYNESYNQSIFSGYPYSDTSSGSIAKCFPRLLNAVLKPTFRTEERRENPNQVGTSGKREASDGKTWHKPQFRDEADEAAFYLVTKYLENPDMKW